MACTSQIIFTCLVVLLGGLSVSSAKEDSWLLRMLGAWRATGYDDVHSWKTSTTAFTMLGMSLAVSDSFLLCFSGGRGELTSTVLWWGLLCWPCFSSMSVCVLLAPSSTHGVNLKKCWQYYALPRWQLGNTAQLTPLPVINSLQLSVLHLAAFKLVIFSVIKLMS